MGKESLRNKETITFYWRGNDLWCRLPQGIYVDSMDRLLESKVVRIEGNFDDQKLVIRFSKTLGHQVASDRVIETGSATNLDKTLLWIRDNQGRRQEYLDESVLAYVAEYELNAEAAAQAETVKRLADEYVENRLADKASSDSCRMPGFAPPPVLERCNSSGSSDSRWGMLGFTTTAIRRRLPSYEPPMDFDDIVFELDRASASKEKPASSSEGSEAAGSTKPESVESPTYIASGENPFSGN